MCERERESEKEIKIVLRREYRQCCVCVREREQEREFVCAHAQIRRSRASNNEIEQGIECEREREQIILCVTASDSMYDAENKRGCEKVCERERVKKS